MTQVRTVLSRLLSGDRERRHRVYGVVTRGRVSRGNSTLLDRILDLLIIFRRPVPIPVKTPRRIR